MQRLTRIRIHDAMDFIRAEGGSSDIIDLGLRKIADALDAEMDDEDLVIPDDSDDFVVDGPEPDDDAGEEDNPPSAARETPSEGAKRHKLELTPGEITAGHARILRIINQRTPPDIPTLVRACLDEGMKLAELEAITGLGYYTLAKCRSGTVTATVKKRFDELFAFPRFHEQEQENEEEE